MANSSANNGQLHLPSLASQIPDGWEWQRLDSICEGIWDCPHSTPKITPYGPLMVRSQDIRTGTFLAEQAACVSEETYQDRVRRSEPSFGDLVYSREGTYFGIAAEVPRETRVCLGQRMVLLRPKREVFCTRYLKYWLNSPVLAAHTHGQRDGTVAERLNLPTIRALPVPVAPLSEQTRIADILGTLDDKIELNRRINATLEAMARRLFKSWFVDFDPTHAKAALRRQHPKWSNARLSREALPNLDPKIAELFPDELLESVLGEIPKGWKAVPLPEAIEVNPKRTLAKGTVTRWLDMARMPTRSARATSYDLREFKSGTKFINGDTLVARITPCLENGKTAFVDFLADETVGAGSTEYIVLHPLMPLPPEYGYFLARTEKFRKHLISNMTGTSGRQRAPSDCLNAYHVIVPHEGIADCFGDFASDALTQMKSLDGKTDSLTVTRDRLLPKLLSGEISVLPEGTL